MKTKIDISDFAFMPAGHGHYKVTYTSPVTGKQWTATINDMPLLDAVRYSDRPKIKDLESLKYLVKNA